MKFKNLWAAWKQIEGMSDELARKDREIADLITRLADARAVPVSPSPPLGAAPGGAGAENEKPAPPAVIVAWRSNGYCLSVFAPLMDKVDPAPPFPVGAGLVLTAPEYPLFDVAELRGLLAYWRDYEMPPVAADPFICRKRALQLAAFVDRQVGRPLFTFEGSHPWALGPDGRPGPHVYNGALDMAGAPWLVDPAWLPGLCVPWPKDARTVRGYA